MRTRVLSAAVLLPLAVGLVVAGGLPYLMGVIAMCCIATWECTGLFRILLPLSDAKQWRYATVGVGGLLLVAVQIGESRPLAAETIAGLCLVAGLLALLAAGAPARHFATWAAAAASLLYIVGLGAHLVLLRATVRGMGWVFLACLVTWSTDIGAYFIGRRFGRRPFFHTISPKKTREGAVGGLLAGIVAAVVAAGAWQLRVPSALPAVIGLTVSISAQAGDLIESLLKREAGVKDSGTLIPGHGGMLDRIDSLLLAVTVTFYWRLLFP